MKSWWEINSKAYKDDSHSGHSAPEIEPFKSFFFNKKDDMFSARQETEISVRIGQEPHKASATTVIASYPDVEVFTMRSYCNRDGVVLLLVTTDAVKTSRVLKAAGFQCEVNPIVLIGPINRSGWAAPVGDELANAGIEVLYSYTSHKDRDRHYLVFKTSDDDRAIQVLTAGSAFQSLTCGDSQPDREMVTVD
jgi:hypothetical protein